jgi:tetratricopeptide (TPR) repeat protein
VGTALLGEACAHLGDAARAEVLYDRLLPLADGLVVCANGIVCLGATSRVLGCLATTLRRFETAEAHFEHALALNTRIGARSFLVRTRRAYATMLLDRAAAGDPERAATQVEAGLALAGELGMALELRRLDDLARRT